MYYKCNSEWNGMLALIRFSDRFYLVVLKHFFNSVYKPLGYKPPSPPPFIILPKTPYEVI